MAKSLKINIHRDLDLQCHRDLMDKIMTREFYAYLNPAGQAYFISIMCEFTTKRDYVLQQQQEYLLQVKD